MKKFINILEACLIIILIGFIIKINFFTENNISTIDSSKFNKTIDSLQNKIDSLEKNTIKYDSISNSNKEEIKKINNNYEKDHITIINQSVSDDIAFFTKYLSENRERLYSFNYNDSIKRN